MNKRFENVDAEISAGRVWRAKEILSGMMAGSSYDTELFEKMGFVLLRMEDEREAGKYFFLSGVRSAEIQAALELFLFKAQKSSFANFWSKMPVRAKHGGFGDLPVAVQKELAAMAFKEKDIDQTFAKYAKFRARRAKNAQSNNSSPTLKGQVIGWMFAGIAIILIAGFMYQAGRGISALWALLVA